MPDLPAVSFDDALRSGRLVVIGKDPAGRPEYRLCKCDCGNTVTVHISNLYRHTRSCGCLRVEAVKQTNRKKRTYHPGDRFGSLTLKERISRPGKVNPVFLFQCDCGREHKVTNLRKARMCRHCYTKKRREKTRANKVRYGLHEVIGRYKLNAKKRNYVWNISDELAEVLFRRDCHYCGEPPSKLDPRYKAFLYNGIDRVDNSKGYTPDNVVPCCTTCNIAKRSMTEDKFVRWAVKVAKHHSEHVNLTNGLSEAA